MHISQRSRGVTGSITLTINARAKELRTQGLDVVGFGAGEPDFNTPAPIVAAAEQAMREGKTKYTPASGLPELKEAICRKLERDNGLSYVPSQIVISGGAKQTLFQALQCVVDPGDEVIIPSPCWLSYPEMVKLAGGVPVLVRCTEVEGFLPDIEKLRAAVTDRTRAIIINSPSNPTGAVYTAEELQKIADLAVEKGLWVITDEIYEKLVYSGQKPVSIASLGEAIREQTIVVNGLSKAYAMTGWRIGYCAAPREIAAAMANFQSHAASAPNTIAQVAGVTALDGPEESVQAMNREFHARRDLICEMINAIDGLSCLVPDGAFYIMVNLEKVIGKSFAGQRIEDDVSFCTVLLDQALVAVVPGSPFDAPNFVRLSYATSRENIVKGVTRIGEFVAGLE